MDYVVRINLKTACKNRTDLVDFCLKASEQSLAIGWSYIYDNNNISDFTTYYSAVKKSVKRINHVLNIFNEVGKNDLFWTRDLEGYYWICRAKEIAKHKFDKDLDIGAIVPVEAYKVGLEVPGAIKASFNRPYGGVAQKIEDHNIIEFSKYTYNKLSNKKTYEWISSKGNLLDNLPDFELEELILAYLQIKLDYYVLSNSIANKSTTIKIECELISRNKHNREKAVVQVKGGNTTINAVDYEQYLKDGYIVYLYASKIENINKDTNCISIHKDEIMRFYQEYKDILPDSITKWENLFL